MPLFIGTDSFVVAGRICRKAAARAAVGVGLPGSGRSRAPGPGLWAVLRFQPSQL